MYNNSTKEYTNSSRKRQNAAKLSGLKHTETLVIYGRFLRLLSHLSGDCTSQECPRKAYAHGSLFAIINVRILSLNRDCMHMQQDCMHMQHLPDIAFRQAVFLAEKQNYLELTHKCKLLLAGNSSVGPVFLRPKTAGHEERVAA
jgi:hypothetical protein